MLAETGIFAWAARAASPHCDKRTGAVNSFRDLVKRDPRFACEVEEAMAEANARLEHTAYKRAVEGVPEAVFQKGQQAVDSQGRPAIVTRYSDNLLLRLLEKRDPESWSQHRQIAHSGSIGRVPAGAVAVIALEDVEALSADQRRQLAAVLRSIQAFRRQRDGEAGDGEVIDVDFEEVGEAGMLPPPGDVPMAHLSEADVVALEEVLS